MRMSSVLTSKYLKHADLDGKSAIRVTIKAVELETMGRSNEEAAVLYFHEVERGLVLNRTINKTIVGFYGDETDEWIGKPLVLFPSTADFNGETHDVIRCRALRAADKVATTQMANEPAATKPQDDLDDDVPF
jgi:hypothetical protein